MSRFSLAALIRGHFKSLRDRRYSPSRFSWTTVALLYGLPLAVGATFYFYPDAMLKAPAVILTALALLAGAFLTSFTHISTLRMKLTERTGDHEDTELPDRNLTDEAATHLLMGAFSSIVTAVVLVVCINFQSTNCLIGVPAAIVCTLCTWVALILLIAVPRLYDAYLVVNKVPDAMSGTFKGKN